MSATGRTLTSAPDLTHGDIRAAILADIPRRAYALASEAGAGRDPWRYRWRIGAGTARALVIAQELALAPPGSHLTRDPGPIPAVAQLLGSACDVVDDLPFGTLELVEVDRDLTRWPYGSVAGDVLDVRRDGHTYRVRVDRVEGGTIHTTTLEVDGRPVEQPGPITRRDLDAAVGRSGPIYDPDLAVDALVELLAARGIRVEP